MNVPAAYRPYYVQVTFVIVKMITQARVQFLLTENKKKMVGLDLLQLDNNYKIRFQNCYSVFENCRVF
jgi:hypothetical protein